MDDDWLDDLLETLGGMEEDYPLDEIFRLLSDQYVRYTLDYLSASSTTSLGELADIIAGLEAVEQETIITPVDHDRIRIRLYHVVLPQLDECGYIQFDATDRTIEQSNVPSPVVALLDEIP